MIIIVVVAALAGAFVNASAIVMMRRAAGVRLPHELFRKEMFLAIAKKKLWLASVGLQLLGFLLQAVALNYGSIILVEPIMTMVLVFLFLILHFRYKIKAGLREWMAVIFVCAGLIAALAAAQPGGGDVRYEGASWFIVIGAVVAVIIAATGIMRRSASAHVRAIVGGVAAAANIGLTAALTKLALEELNQGIGALLTDWVIYVLVLSGIATVIVLQSVFAAGPLVISQPIIEIVNPIVSAIIAVNMFNSVINTSAAAVGITIPGLGLTVVGLAMIGSSKRYQRAHVT